MQLILLSLVVYRVTRFIILDTLIQHQRIVFLNKLQGKKPSAFRNKIAELFTCPYCMSIWVAAASVAVLDLFESVRLPVFMWLAVAAGSLLVWRHAEPAAVEVSMGSIVKHKEAKYE